MGNLKLQNEKKLLTFFSIATFVLSIGSAIFMYLSIKKDELGGSFVSAMLLFICVYGFFVFIAKVIKYSFLEKLQKAIVDNDIVEISELSDKFNRSEKKIVESVNYLMKNNYIEQLTIYNGRLINPEAKRIANEIIKRKIIEKKQHELDSNVKEEVVQSKKKKNKIESEKCPNCGARIKFENGSAECPYCGNSLNKV